MAVKTDRIPLDPDLRDFLASEPPRRVPDAYRKAALHQGAPQTPAVILAVFGILSLPLVALFFPWQGLRDWKLSGASVPQVSGVIDSVTPTSISENHRRIYAYAFSFAPVVGVTVRGTCYTTGLLWRPGTKVPVSYLPDSPEVACPKGARLSRVGTVGIVTLFFPLCAVVACVSLMRTRARVAQILTSGRLLDGRILAVRKPGILEAKRHIKVISLSVGDQVLEIPCYRGSLKTFAQAKCGAGESVIILQHPARERAVLFPELF